VTQWETFYRRALRATNKLLCHEDMSFLREFLFYSRFSNVDSCLVWMLIIGYINQLRGETATDLRMGVPALTANFNGLPVTPTETQRR
jgi:hypothetical protein